ncbi:MAG: class I SAM-dependent methyltransferase, partial [Candidatus Hydrogenedentes bacterium]|nr:class I SAM-dependent methyltransferase [Candidatus Hydrogenedentota bacterium]
SRRLEINLIRRYLDVQAGDRLCDIGSGDGYWMRRITGAAHTTGLDIDWPSHLAARENLVKNHTEFVMGSAEAMPFEDEFFDKIFGICSVEHIADRESAFAEIRRCLKVNGVLALTLDSLTYPTTTDAQRARHHERFFTPHLYDLETVTRCLEGNGMKLTDYKFIVSTAVGNFIYRMIERRYRLQYPFFLLFYPLILFTDTFFSANRHGWKLAIRAVRES